MPGASAASGAAQLPPAEVHDAAGVAAMRAACRTAAEVLNFAGSLVRPGVTTEEIDRVVHEACVSRWRVYPSPLNYMGFPKSLCTSVNEVVCHGIPDARPLRDGDIVNIDVSTYVGGYHGDTSRTFLVGDAVPPAARALVERTWQCMHEAIALCRPGVPFNAVGAHIQSRLDAWGYSGVASFAGHGIGRTFHTLPIIHHHRNAFPGVMKPGMTFTIEPMVCEGSSKVVRWDDDWTIATEDGSLSAQCEHTVLITPLGHEILTLAPGAPEAAAAGKESTAPPPQ